MYKTLAKYLSVFMQRTGIKWLVSYVTTAAGVAASGFWAWCIALAVKWGWKKADEKIKSEAAHADRKNSDEDVNTEYQNKIKDGASEEELIKSELDILNPRRG